MTGCVEDRCELMAFIMSAKENPELMKHYYRDSIIRRKVWFIAEFVINSAGVDFIETEKYQQRIMKLLYFNSQSSVSNYLLNN